MKKIRVSNELSNVLHTVSENIEDKMDASCISLVKFKCILARILKECMEEFAECSLEEIEQEYILGTPVISEEALHRNETPVGKQKNRKKIYNPCIGGDNTEDKSISEGVVVYDIRFRVRNPKATKEVFTMLINIECQAQYYKGYPIVTRGVYYGSRMISSQYGTIFTKSHYEKLNKVYSIWLILDPPKYRKNTMNRYSLCEVQMVGSYKEKKVYYDLLTVVMIALGDAGDPNCKGVIGMLTILLSSELDIEEKKRRLSQEYGIEMTTEMEKEATDMCDYSKMIKDQGRKEGIKEGKKEGIELGQWTAIQSLMKTMHMTLEQAMDVLLIPEAMRIKYRTRR